MAVSSLFEASWYKIGLNLLNEDDEHKLDLIKINCRENTNKCCMEMLKLWLQKQPNASWDQLIEALKSEGVELNYVASIIEGKLIKSAKGNIMYHCCSVRNNFSESADIVSGLC